MSVMIMPIDIYLPKIMSGEHQSKIENVKNDDFDISYYAHFAVVLSSDGSLWKHANLYLLSKLKSYAKPSHKTLEAIARDLSCFQTYCETENIDYLSVTRKATRPTYVYRSHLNQLHDQGKISPNTLKKRMSAVVGFYEYLINVEKMSFKLPLWESADTYITYKDTYGFKKAKAVITKDVVRIASTKNESMRSNIIIDGSQLRPLSQVKQSTILKALKRINNVEMLYGFLIALTTGARIQTVFTLKIKHFTRRISENEQEVRIKVGYGTGADTKNNKVYELFMPTWLYTQIQIYIQSERAIKRRAAFKQELDFDEQYLFLTNRGSPYYLSSNDPHIMLYKDPPNGGAVRQFIAKTLKEKLHESGNDFHFSFHDLRATFGMNLFDQLSPLIDNKEITATNALMTIRERMGHSSLTTTERYLNFRTQHKIKQAAQINYEHFFLNEILK